MKSSFNYSSRFRILKGGKISLVVSALLGTTTLSFAAPSGGVVTSGNASINQVGKTTNINQSTSKASINWQKFGIKADEVVNFIQPNKNSITLNRVIGNERSIIDGALNANGQVWILNSNGVLFGKNASINTSGLLATTKNLSDTDFQSGNYNFSGDSTESIINQGTIKIKDNGYVILASNEVRNSGEIEAVKGRVQLTGADEYTINLNGNSLVDLVVDKGVLDALVENSGTILADGGEVYLTTHAVDELLRGVVNNTGIIEANSLDGISGHVELFAHGGEIQVGGEIRAKDGFVETSGKFFSFNDAKIEAGEWLIDPVDVTIDATLANAIQSQLASGDMTVETVGAGADDGDITVNSDITWSSTNRLTLNADDQVIMNAKIENTNNSDGEVYFITNNGVVFNANGKVVINNVHQLQAVDTALNGTYELGSNIDASDTRNWGSGAGFKQIGDNSTDNINTRFTGNFDGKGYIIDGLYINRPSEIYVGLFGYANGATISNFGLTNVDIKGNGFIGSVLGIMRTGTLSDIYVTGKISGKQILGGVLGALEAGTVKNIYSVVSVDLTTGGMNPLAGGLIGWIQLNAGAASVSNSYVAGQITSSGTSTNLGSVVGYNQSNLTFSNVYYDTDATGVMREEAYNNAHGATAINSSNAFNQATYAGFDFTNDWFMIEGETRPFLRSEYSTTITNDHQLQLMAMDLSANYTLANDIKYTGNMWSSKGFDPIGDSFTNHFSGNLDGQGHVIDGLYINRGSEEYVGLIGYTIGSNISNIGLTNLYVKADESVGGLIGRSNLNSLVSNAYAIGEVIGSHKVGGLIGYANNTTINTSYTNTTLSSGYNMGGLVGYSDDNLNINNSYATGDITGTDKLGGLVGIAYYTLNMTNSYATGKISGNLYIGGLVGSIRYSGHTISNSYYDRDTTGVTSGIGYGSYSGSFAGIYSSTNTINAFDEATYAGFDFTNDWIIYEGHTRPLLRTFMTEITVSANDHTRTYDGTTYSGSAGVTYSIPTHDSSLVYGTLAYTSSDDLKNAGTATINVDGLYSSQHGYIISYDTGTLTTNKKDITVTGNSKTTTYDGTTQTSSGFTASGLVSGETIAVLDGVTGDNVIGTNAGTYNTNLSGTDENYNITFVDGSLVINKRALSLEAKKDYDGTDDLTGFVTFGNLVGAETLEYTGAKANSSNPVANNFIKEITLQDGTNGGVASNYELPSLLAYSVNNSVQIGDIPVVATTPDLTSVITPIANQTVLTNKDIEALLKSGVDIQTIVQQLNTNELALIPGIVMKVLNGGINLPFGSKQQFSLNQENEDEDNNTI